ncbi:MAG TPA: haloacid dehalogenase type II [Holophagaceae bacterium]|nr:haloacid dehalogenase type II [Holophagaceae bacterium]
MGSTRREFLELGALAALGGALGTSPSRLRLPARSRIKAVAFDGFPVIDPRPVAARAEELFPGRGAELMNAWRTRQFEYTWLRTLSHQYADFWHVTEEALRFAAKSLKLELPGETRDRLLGTYLELKAWPDVAPALKALKAAGIRMAFLSNFTAPMLDAALKNASLDGFFEPHLSTDRVRAYKPDPRAYQMGLDAFKLKRDEVAFAASAGWDVAGAAWFGYPTIWINRMDQPAEELGVAPAATGRDLRDLVAFVGA